MKINGLILVLGLVAGVAGRADASPEEIAELKAQLQALSARLTELESERSVPITPVPPPPPASPSATKAKPAMALKSDLRYRHETIDEDGLDRRDRQRIRARIAVTGQVTDDIEVGMRFATGGSNPVSANQSLDGGFSTKSIGLDMAYFTWTVNDNLNLTGGKMKNPFIRAGDNGLVWDSDLNPEGLAVSYNAGPITLIGAGLWAEERSGSSDSFILGGQVAYSMTVADGMKLKLGGGYFDYLQAEGETPFFDGSGAGNILDAGGNYVNDFNQLEFFGELGTDWAGRPASLFVDYVTNTDADDFDTGWALGGKYGKASNPGTWEVMYVYQDLEANAVVGTFTDSNFGGGGTDGTGHVIKAGYALSKNLTLKLTYFLNERGENAGNERDYNRLQADVQFKL